MAALSVLYCLLQLGVILLLGAADIGNRSLALNLPLTPSLRWLIDQAALLGLLMLLASLLFFAVSWGLLVRHEWARRGFIAILLVTALFNFVGLLFINELFAGLLAMFPVAMLDSGEGKQVVAQLDLLRWTLLIMSGLMSLAFAALHGWLALKLCKPEVLRQFHSKSSTSLG